MSVLTTILLTIITLANIFLITVIAFAARKCKEKNSLIGSVVMLSVLIADMLAIMGGVIL